ncbi:glycosyltransferase family 39 protein [Cerasicoccus maritimus]|uniref:glycosyltransferase family 39 protein n=1 Tax=Cerasicoccus maritimus TaxID=490089 RepID=UPI0028525830|nr:glycosyltransferase family 39 protein [Cerasicoccus maritimus]
MDLEKPGLYYDEVLFVNAALGEAVPGLFVHSRLFDTPVQLMPYIGALKAWLFAPIFAVFGVTPLTIRLPSLIIGAAGLWIGFLTVRRTLGARWALIFTGLCAASPGFFLVTRHDWGPDSLMLLFKAISLYCLVRWIQSGRKKWLAALTLTFALGLFDKLNFIWYIAAFAAATPLCFPSAFRILLNKHAGKALAIAAVFGVAAAIFILPLLELPDLATMLPRLNQITTLINATFDGNSIQALFLEEEVPLYYRWSFILLACLVAGMLLLACNIWRSWQRRNLSVKTITQYPPLDWALKLSSFSAIVGTIIFLEIVITPQAGGPHHAMMIFPYPQLILVAACACWANLPTKISKPVRNAGVVLTAFAIVVVLLADAQATVYFQRQISQTEKFKAKWSTAIYELGDLVNEKEATNSYNNIVLGDWGLATQLIGMVSAPSRRKMLDYWPTFSMRMEKSAAIRAEDDQRIYEMAPFIGILFAEEHASFSATRSGFIDALNSIDVDYTIDIIHDGDEALYEVYTVTPRNPDAH